MKKSIGCLLFFAFGIVFVFAQSEPASDPAAWEFNAHANLYFIPEDFFILPVFQADKNKLHLEARYNYEDRETFSAWVGYNFQGGKKLEYTITPMLGGVVGRSDGMAPGLEVTLDFKGFALYTEAEVYLDFQGSQNHYLYSWTDFSYSPKDWFWFGISAQRTRSYQTELDLQRGLLIGVGFKNWELTTYAYNLGFEDPFVLISISKQF
jgi:hypothetical protein